MDMDAGVRVNGISQADVAKFETLFKLLDVEETGVIQEEQLADLMPRMGVFLSEEGLHSLFQSVDVDGSGNIDFNEFLMLMARHREANQLALLKGGRECFRYLKAASTLNHVSRSDSISNWIFDLVSLVTILWYVGIVLYEDVRQKSFPYAAGPYLKTVFGVYCFVDIARWARTALPSEDGPDTLPVDDATRVRSHYIRSRAFIFDALAALPLDLLFLYMGDDMVMRWCQHLRLFKLFTYSRLFRLSAQDTISPAYARFYFAVVPLCKILFLACVSIHILSMLWIVISPDSPDYVPSVYFVVYTLTTTGYGDIDVTTDLQRMFAIFLFVCASIVTGLVVGKLVQISQQGDLQGDMSRTMLETLAALSHLTIPPDFREEVLAFQLHRLKHSNSLFNDTITGLPQCMQDRMALYARMKIVRQMSIFADASDICVAKLAQSLVNVFAPPEEYIVIAGEEGEEMFFLFHGMCCVTKPNGKWVATIKRGGLFGEVALLTETRRSSSIKSLTYCQLFRLDKVAFETIIQRFPNLLDSIQKASKCLNDRIAGQNQANAQPQDGAAGAVAAVPDVTENPPSTDSDNTSSESDSGEGEAAPVAATPKAATSKTETLVRRQGRSRGYTVANAVSTVSVNLSVGENSISAASLPGLLGANGADDCNNGVGNGDGSDGAAHKSRQVRYVMDGNAEDNVDPSMKSPPSALRRRMRSRTQVREKPCFRLDESTPVSPARAASISSDAVAMPSPRQSVHSRSSRKSSASRTSDNMARSRFEKTLLRQLGSGPRGGALALGGRSPAPSRHRVLSEPNSPREGATALAASAALASDVTDLKHDMSELKAQMAKILAGIGEIKDRNNEMSFGGRIGHSFYTQRDDRRESPVNDASPESPRALKPGCAGQKKPSLLRVINDASNKNGGKGVPLFDLSDLEAKMDGGAEKKPDKADKKASNESDNDTCTSPCHSIQSVGSAHSLSMSIKAQAKKRKSRMVAS